MMIRRNAVTRGVMAVLLAVLVWLPGQAAHAEGSADPASPPPPAPSLSPAGAPASLAVGPQPVVVVQPDVALEIQRARRQRIAGIAMVPSGVALVLGGTGWLVVSALCGSDGDSSNCNGQRAGAGVLLVVGVLTAVGGGILWAEGNAKLSRLQARLNERLVVGAAPERSVGGSLGWRF
jgi:hypothetical protein